MMYLWRCAIMIMGLELDHGMVFIEFFIGLHDV